MLSSLFNLGISSFISNFLLQQQTRAFSIVSSEVEACFHLQQQLIFIVNSSSSSSSAPTHLCQEMNGGVDYGCGGSFIFIFLMKEVRGILVLEPLALFHQRWRLAFIFNRSSYSLSGPTHLRQWELNLHILDETRLGVSLCRWCCRS
ncbi:hypothetical protein Patl1_37369 [Pistacia atlantica]|nr:hypothetical protein Patl1_37369 [Pistacia atlantica]